MYFVKVRGNLFYMKVTIQSLKHNKQNIHVVTRYTTSYIVYKWTKNKFYVILYGDVVKQEKPNSNYWHL